MPLNLDKLTNVNRRPDGSRIARCPACAETGHDNKGEHLIIYPDGRYGCVVHSRDHEHRKRVFSLVGYLTNTSRRSVRIAIKPKV